MPTSVAKKRANVTGWHIMSILFGIATLVALGIGLYQIKRNSATEVLILDQSTKLRSLEDHIIPTMQRINEKIDRIYARMVV